MQSAQSCLNPGIVFRIYRIAQQRFPAAMAQEMAQGFVALERAQEHFLVIAGQDAHAPPLRPSAGGIDHAGTVWPAIDQVTQQDHGGLHHAVVTARGVIGFDQGNHLLEQVEPAVNVTHRIDALARRNQRGRSRRFCPRPGNE